MKNAFTLLVLLIFAGCTAQQANIWYFGYGAGLDFNSGAPVALTDGATNTDEGVATVADQDGNLLMYTDGMTVWNKNHVPMPDGTGLLGDNSSSQSAIIVQKPGFVNIYFIFTVDKLGESEGLNYSEIDMSLDGGLGNVTVNKNIQMQVPTTEQLTAVRHQNGSDIWVIVRGAGNNSFSSYLITAAGISVTPVVSNAGIAPGPVFDNIGCMKASPSGERIATANNISGTQLFDFDTATGVVSNAVTLSDQGQSYGVEFSPSGNVLYISNIDCKVWQYNLLAPDIPASAVLVLSGNSTGGALQLAPDGKIYWTRLRPDLSVINNPEGLGTACDAQLDAISLSGKVAALGLPNFIQSYFSVGNITAENLCLGDSTHFKLQFNITPDTITWQFGDGGTSAEAEPSHTYAMAGTYLVQATATYQNEQATVSQSITIFNPPLANTPDNMLLCDAGGDGQEVFNLQAQDAAILGGQPPQTHTVTYHDTPEDAEAGTAPLPANFSNSTNPQVIYARVINNDTGCYAFTSFTVEVLPSLTFDLPDEAVFCAPGPGTLTGPPGFDGYLWSTGQATRSITVTQPGNYSLTVFKDFGSQVCEATQAILVTFKVLPAITAVSVSDWTYNSNSITIAADEATAYSIDGVVYQESPVFTGLESGLYTVYARNECGIAQEEALLLMYPKFFTPNGDGVNDTWRIKYAQLEPQLLIHIFDRYGKLLYSFRGDDTGWDGKLDGRELPSTDYWFVAIRQDGRQYKGHFSMLR